MGLEAATALAEFGVACEVRVMSAHRTPHVVAEYATTAEERGLGVIIAAAGGAAHLAGVIAAKNWKPVLAVPMESKLDGLDSLLSMVQMPAGIPVPTLAIGKAGAINAALAAAAILAIGDSEAQSALEGYRRERSAQVLADPDPRQPPPA